MAIPSFTEAQDSLFQRPDRLLKLTLQADFKKVNSISGPSEDPKKYKSKGKLSGENFVLDVSVRPRGNARMIECKDMKPLYIKFKGKRKGTPFQELNKKIKVVTHCQEDESHEEVNQELLVEFYRFRLLNILNGMSRYICV